MARKKNRSRKRRKKTNTGKAFEKRAARAMQHLYPELEFLIDEKLVATYGVNRQFDVLAKDPTKERPLKKLYEAKDYRTSKVSLEKVEAFETKLRELVDPPSDGGAMISAEGFQSGILKRAKVLGDASNIKDFFILRKMTSDSWGNRIREFTMQGTALVPEIFDVNFVQDKSKGSKTFLAQIDRENSFVYNKSGELVGNLMDRLNLEINQISNLSKDDGEVSEHQVDFSEDCFLKLDIGKVEFRAVKFKFRLRKQLSNFSIDFSNLVADKLENCLTQEEWLIPDENKSLSASGDSKNIALNFKDSDQATIDALLKPGCITSKDFLESESRVDDLLKSIFMRVLLGLSVRDRSSSLSEMEKDKYSRKVEEASALQANGDVDKAKKLYWEVLGQGTCLEALINLACIYQYEDIKQAKYLCNRACELFPDNVEGFVAMGELFLLEKDFESVEKILEPASIFHSHDPKFLDFLGKFNIKKEDYASACFAFNDILAKNPDSHISRLRLAFCEYKLGRFDAAFWDAKEAVQMVPEKIEYQTVAAKYAFLAKKFCYLNSSIEFLKKQHGESVDELLHWTARSVEESGMWEVFYDVFPLAKDLESENYFLYKAACELNLSLFMEADKSYEECLKMNPRQPVALINRANLLANRKKYEEAVQCLHKVEREDRKGQEYSYTLALCNAGLKKRDELLSAIDIYGNSGGDAEDLAQVCGEYLCSVGDLQLGSEVIQKSYEFRSENPKVILKRLATLLPMAFQARQETDSLIKEFEQIKGAVATEKIFSWVECWARICLPDEKGYIKSFSQNSDFTNLQVNQLALACFNLNWSEALKRTVEKLPKAVTTEVCKNFVHPDEKSLFFLVALHQGENVDEKFLLAKESKHPLDILAYAYKEFLFGDLRKALKEISRLDEIAGIPVLEANLLRWQIQIELMQYKDVQKSFPFPSEETKKSSKWWSHKGNMTPLEITPDQRDQLRFGLVLQDGDYVAVLYDGQKIGGVVSPVRDWLNSFHFLEKLERKDAVPVLVRMKTPFFTARRFRKVFDKKVVDKPN